MEYRLRGVQFQKDPCPQIFKIQILVSLDSAQLPLLNYVSFTVPKRLLH